MFFHVKAFIIQCWWCHWYVSDHKLILFWNHKNFSKFILGSQDSTSSQPLNITLIPTNRKSLDEFRDHQPSTKKKKTLPASQTKRRKTSALSEVNSLLADSDEDSRESQASMTGRKTKKHTGRGRHASSLESTTDSDSAGKIVNIDQGLCYIAFSYPRRSRSQLSISNKIWSVLQTWIS